MANGPLVHRHGFCLRDAYGMLTGCGQKISRRNIIQSIADPPAKSEIQVLVVESAIAPRATGTGVEEGPQLTSEEAVKWRSCQVGAL